MRALIDCLVLASTIAATSGWSQPLRIQDLGNVSTIKVDVPRDAQACQDTSLEGWPIDLHPSALDHYTDRHCSGLVLQQIDPFRNGVVSVFGSSSLKPDHLVYQAVKQLLGSWGEYQQSLPPARRIPLLTGGGPGLMEAANCAVNKVPVDMTDSARAAYSQWLLLRGQNGDVLNKSIGFGSTFSVRSGMPPTLLSGSKEWELNGCVTDGYLFRSFSVREAEMIDSARIGLFAPGGFGTEWELYEMLTKIQTHKAPSSSERGPPMVILFMASALDASLPIDDSDLMRVAGHDYREKFARQKSDVEFYYQTLIQRLIAMRRLGTIKANDLGSIKCATSAFEALALMKANAENRAIPQNFGLCEGLNVN